MRRLALAGLAAAAAGMALPVAAGAATITVTTVTDELNGGGDCSLREAVQSASTDMAVGGCPAGSSMGGDAIELAPGATYLLALGGGGEDLNSAGDLDASVAAAPLKIQPTEPGTRPVIKAAFAPGQADRLLDVTGGNAFTVAGVVLEGGAAETGTGGAIRWQGPSAGDLTVDDAVLRSNSAEQVSAVDADTTGTHTIRDSTISDNLAFDLGTVRSKGELRLIRSAVLGNTGGGVIALKTGADSLEMDSSTVAGNTIGADLSVGGVAAEGEASIVNSTISRNIGGFVGGVELAAPSSISFSTIAENGAPEAGGFATGGIGTELGTTVTLDGVVLAGNRVDATPSNCGAGVTVAEGPSPNLEDGDTCELSAVGGSFPDTPADLAPLADNGGPTPTRGLYPGSAAIDAGLPACAPVVDQRGVTRPDGPGCDLGAFEGTVERPQAPPGPVVPQSLPSTPVAPAAPKKQKKCRKKTQRKVKGKCVTFKKKKKRSAGGRALAAEVLERVVVGESVRGRKIVATRIGDPAGQRVALAVGVIHGDERAGLEVLSELQASDLQGVQLWVIPTVNPDGQRARQRRNARGVDLNRNFPFRWRGGVPKSSGYYPGASPASEPETKAMMAFIERIKPQVSVWYHQPWGAVLACRGFPDAAARYASLSGMRTSCRGKNLRGTAISWQRDAFPGTQNFVVELGARGVTQGIARRHATALATIARDG